MVTTTGPLTVPDLLTISGEQSGRRVAARQAVAAVRRHRVRRFFAVVLTVVLTAFATLAAYYVGLFFFLDRTVERVDALAVDAPGIISPQAQAAADNFLIVGTEGFGSQAGVTSALIAHLTPERDRAVLISLPLTAFVDVPACPVGTRSLPLDPYGGSLGSSFASGGAGCLVRAVQQLSGMRLDHYVQLDLERLPSMADALGGVPVCLPSVETAAGEATTPAGLTVLHAEQVRAILVETDSDRDPTGQLATDRQRLLLASTLREALRLENLINPFALTGFISEVAYGLILDPRTTLGQIKELGDKLGEFTGGDTLQTGVPLSEIGYRPTASEQSYTLIDDVASRTMFQAIISNNDLPAPAGRTGSDPGTASTPTPAPTAEPIATPPSAQAPEVLTVAPQQITVNVYNGVGTRGLATDGAAALAAQGFVVGEVENQVTGATESVVRYAPGQLEAARTVAAAVANSVLQEGPTAGGGIDLVLGSSFSGVLPVAVAEVPPEDPAGAEQATPSTAGSPPSVDARNRASCG